MFNKLIHILTLYTLSAWAQNDVEELKKLVSEQAQHIRWLQTKIEALDQERQEEKKSTQGMLQELNAKGKSDRAILNKVAFIPEISLILDGSYNTSSLRDTVRTNSEIPGLTHTHTTDDGHSHGATGANGFNLNYGELVMKSTVDHLFDAVAMFHLSNDGFEIEEAYAKTRGLPYALAVKAGKFYSHFGRINAQHSHYWNFVDQPIVYNAFFGGEGLKDAGLQLTWIAPTPTYLQFGFEALQGTNENSFGINAITDQGLTVKSTNRPNVIVGFMKNSFDIGEATVLTGISMATGQSRIDHFTDNDPHAFAGRTQIYGADLTIKYPLDSYRYISLQTEYLQRYMHGTKYWDHDTDETTPLKTLALKKDQAGYYSEIIYKFDPQWRIGGRYEAFTKNDVNGMTIQSGLDKMSLMIDYLPSEFSRLRLQYHYDRSKFYADDRVMSHDLILQLNLALGAHGAHTF